jgi:hypothetical protein
VRRTSIRPLGLAAVALVFLGCGGQVPLRGVITLDGQPLPKAHVVLSPVDRTAEGPFVGDTDSTGRFALGPIGQPGGGVRPGAYRLSISTAFSLDSDAPAPKELVPAAHVNGVDYEVSAGGDSAVTLDLKSTGKPR